MGDDSENEFKIGSSTYNFKEMTVITATNGWWKLHFDPKTETLYRMGNRGFHQQGPNVLKAFLDWKLEQILLGKDGNL